MGKKLIEGVNDFASWCIQNGRETLLAEWDTENNSCTPNSKSFGSHYKAAWKCSKCGYKWQAITKSRSLLNAGCPKCGFAKMSIAQSQPTAFGDVESFCKTHQLEWLLNEWDDEENNGLKPSEVARSSRKYKIAWKCSMCGYQWKLSPNARIRVFSDDQLRVSECPMCLKEKKTSFPEQAIYYYVTKGFADAVNGDITTIGMELDIFIPSLMMAIEYDGYAWHQDTGKDLRKNDLCKQNGVKIIRVREIGCPPLVDDNYCKVISIQANNREDLSMVLLDLCGILGFDADINLNRDEPLIVALYQKRKYENSFAYLYPEFAQEFHSTKNGTLTVENINKGSARKVWWKCSVCGHDWLAAVSSRADGHGCPACSGRVLVPGKNDLETWCKQTGNEHILAEWDYEVNPISPSETTKKNPYVASWKCRKCGESYRTRVYGRANGEGCPVCSGKKVKSGINDFKSWCIRNEKEAILTEWDPLNELTPNQVSHGSGKRIQWICSVCGHHWSATLDNRKKGKGCPECGMVKRIQSNKMRALKQK